MKPENKLPPNTEMRSLGASLGGTVSSYSQRQNIYSQGAPADSLFFIQEGRVRLIKNSNNRSSAVTAILGIGDLFGAQCLAGFPLRVSTAVAMTQSSIRSIPKRDMVELCRKNNDVLVFLVNYLVQAVNDRQGHIAELLTLTARERLAQVLFRLTRPINKGKSLSDVPTPTQQELAEMIGTTRARVSFFMNDFKRRGYISYENGLEVHASLSEVLRKK